MLLLALDNPGKPVNYKLELDIDPESSDFSGSVDITFHIEKGTIFNEVKLHAGDLSIVSASITNENSTYEAKLDVSYDTTQQLAIFRNHGGNTLSLTECQIYRLKLGYTGKINDIASPGDKTVGVFKARHPDNKGYIIATHCQPSFARLIYPCVDEPSVKTTFELSIISSATMKAVSAASIDVIEDIGSGKVKTIFRKTPLLTTSLFGFTLGAFDTIKIEIPITQIVEGNEEQQFFPVIMNSPMNVSLTSFAIETVKTYLPILVKYFNNFIPYLEKLDFVLLPYLNDMVMENFGMITAHMNLLLLADDKNVALKKQMVQIIVHELVHQWVGNFISFDSWESLSFNESFATWLSYYLISENEEDYFTSNDYVYGEIQPAMVHDSGLNSQSIRDSYYSIMKQLDGKGSGTTRELFNPYSYFKGVSVLRSLQLTTGESLLQKALAHLFTTENIPRFHNMSIKPIDIFNEVGAMLKSENIANYFSSWNRLPGLPILSVTATEDEKTKLVQHRFFSKECGEVNETDFEDVPYHIPLFTLLPDGKNDTKHVLLTDRSLKLDYRILLCNNDAQGYYYVSYESDSLYAGICQGLQNKTISSFNLSKIVEDLSNFIGNLNHQLPIHFTGFFKILNSFISSFESIDEMVKSNYSIPFLKCLAVLETLEVAVYKSKRTELRDQIHKFGTKMFKSFIINKIDLREVPSDQTTIVSKIIRLTRKNQKTINICEPIYKSLLKNVSSTNKFPVDLLESVLIVMTTTQVKTVKQWKEHMRLLKDSHSMKAAFFSSLGYVSTEELVTKLLNFIDSDIKDVNDVTLSLISLCHYNETRNVNNLIWKWFTSSYKQWANKLHDAQSFSQIFTIVLSAFINDAKWSSEVAEQFKDITAVDITTLLDSWTLEQQAGATILNQIAF
ncbi:hypothetical protein KAFR_0J01760 [Kazachstania africana CBS 2517]|uniref:Aminopeptidase n=1 Tax=Kazachstania africana (strain ATCC 22294 / BCRC 22015 / CBS 2517 / CECT 1963 / NBRC 1671 / NRRL Y-8276) TaxID=1071382 RepID=H2B0U0_KAZAF|nr:hypothetical protein KAFR_0J01760 [Kazachstania africana CBS 2517]CCF60240.1 hypothetical protein KAFR_0J01760 [Kazachstania africana CBS 2517]